MASAGGAHVVEFNARFGDPETQVLMPLLAGGLGEALHGCAVGRLAAPPRVLPDACAVGVVLAAAGYPAAPRAGEVVQGLAAWPAPARGGRGGAVVLPCRHAAQGQRVRRRGWARGHGGGARLDDRDGTRARLRRARPLTLDGGQYRTDVARARPARARRSNGARRVDLRRVDPLAPGPAAVTAAAEALLRGGVVAFPTDTVYGLSCLLMDPAAVEFVYRLKHRPAHLSVIALIPDSEAVYPLVESVPEIGEALMARFWPGPLSIIFRASPLVPPRVAGTRNTIALRVPRNPLCEALLEAVGGPIVSSSANLSGQPPCADADEIVAVFGNQIDVVLDGGPCAPTAASTVVDVSGGTPRDRPRGRRGRLRIPARGRPGSRVNRRPGARSGPHPPRLDTPPEGPYLHAMSGDKPPFRVLFVCTGNTCRSPLAEAALKRRLGALTARVDVGSAGVAALAGAPASEGSRVVARAAGLDLEAHRSRRLTAELLRDQDLVLLMEPGDTARVKALAPDATALVMGLADFGRDRARHEAVPDPFGQPIAAYTECLARIEEHLARVVPYIEAELRERAIGA